MSHPLDTPIEAWSDTAERLFGLLHELGDADWQRPTDCPGWSVHDIVAHLAHLEALLAGTDEGAPLRAGRQGPAPADTEQGVAGRRDRRPAELLAELRAAVDVQTERLRDRPDPEARAERAPGDPPWTWEVLLRNRAIDCWVHEQDIRRAVGLPGGLDGPGARFTTGVFAAAMPYVLGKRVAPPPGTSVVWDLTGGVPLTIGATVAEDGRARPAAPDDPTTRLAMTSETFCILGAGRRRPGDLDITVTGDADLGARVLAAMTLTH